MLGNTLPRRASSPASIIPVYDVGSTEDFPCYVVSKHVDGTDLAYRITKSRPSFIESSELVATVAEDLHYAHKQGTVHRDIKPSNILIDGDGKAYVADFGLALREQDFGKGPKYAGTASYMSPEQARSEGHRVDGRSDIFSLGVVLYELLVGRRPFQGNTRWELLEQVTSLEPRPLTQYDERLPQELQRICFKALAKRSSDRYFSAHEFAQDLRHFLSDYSEAGGLIGKHELAVESQARTDPVTQETSQTVSGSTRVDPSAVYGVVPKGLRSFDAHDADFFLELLPGPRDRHGVPASIRFWKTKIEERNPDDTFAVGLIYGPSGCGKSSLVKAGLLPRLSDDVIAVYVEATADETESRLLNGLHKCCPPASENLGLVDTLVALRRGQGIPSGKKIVVVLDQFEQWLHAKKGLVSRIHG